ncbi:DegT/DnrJ/EryC1/StrS family aminotransferase [Aestuariivivens marinum]|uniref:DegT/DnrJ/EryC1/StrS family aminotransferase n=1 Tax=Aestuariivivens marinum TaxID=2913555 RepID=UPI001F5889AB|nr:DegT/DnrJ/EryC1/StrS family aminotransferase [Aestuariivivens marinum]
MINVTKTFLPPQNEYQAILQRAWDTGWLTNRGVLVKELEEKLKGYLGATNILATTNGTLPLQIAIKALGLTGEIITTPFSYVATTSSIVWEGCTPVFVDIHPEHLTIDEAKIEDAITNKTTAILATHVFGNPCHVEVIDTIAKKYNLKVIYDGAHAFGVSYKGQSIFSYGDVSTCSFHATKLFHTGEGGALFSQETKLYEKLFDYHNFGHQGQEDFKGLGTNAKMSELQAAMGLALLPYIAKILDSRRNCVEIYNDAFKDSKVTILKIREGTQWNYSYYPIIFETETQLLQSKKNLNSNNVFPRRYFYPSLNKLPYVTKQEVCVSESISKRVLCLPLYVGLKKADIVAICNIVRS